MYCNICGAEISEADNFCKNCGNPVGENQIEEMTNESQPSEQKEHKPINGVGLFALICSVFELFLMFFHPFIAFFFIGVPTGLLCYYGRKRKPKNIAIAATVITLISDVIFIIILFDFLEIINL